MTFRVNGKNDYFDLVTFSGGYSCQSNVNIDLVNVDIHVLTQFCWIISSFKSVLIEEGTDIIMTSRGKYLVSLCREPIIEDVTANGKFL